jgi:hypothetical protein
LAAKLEFKSIYAVASGSKHNQFRDTQLHPYASNSVKQSTFEEWKQQQNRA